LQAYKPVDIPFGDTSYTLKCQWFPNDNYRQLALFDSRKNANLSVNSDQAMLILAADGDCEAQLAKNEGGQTKVIVIQKHSGMPEGLMSAVIKRTIPAATNGLLTTIVRHELGPDCGNRCAPTFNVSGGNGFAQAASESESELNSETVISNGTNSCQSGNCKD